MNSIDSKHAKYQTQNPISRKLVTGFFDSMTKIYRMIQPKKIFDAGCGEGLVLNTLNEIRPIEKAFAIDIDEKEVIDATRNLPFCQIKQGSIYDIPFEESAFDLVICSEVLEHLEDPDKALQELFRVSSEYAILSVPREPIWRIMNMARFKYWNALGNTPDHRNHWSTKQFVRFLEPYFVIIETLQPLPWTMVLCRKRSIK